MRNALVIGDSISADLFSGMKDHWGDRVHVALAASPSCRPIPRASYPGEACRSRNRVTFESGSLEDFDGIILIGGFKRTSTIPEVAESIEALRARGAKRLVGVGMPPRYVRSVRQVITLFGAESSGRIQSELTKQLDSRQWNGDVFLGKVTRESGAEFVSLIDLLCVKGQDDSRSCQHFIDGGELPIARDWGHSSWKSSVWLWKALDDKGRIQIL